MTYRSACKLKVGEIVLDKWTKSPVKVLGTVKVDQFTDYKGKAVLVKGYCDSVIGWDGPAPYSFFHHRELEIKLTK